MPTYTQSNSLDQSGKDLISRIHPGLNILTIAFLFRDKSSHAQGRIVPARTRKCEDRDRELHGYDFIIEVSKEVWTESDQRFREAILDHELTSIGIHCDEEGIALRNDDDRIKTFTRKPDIMEYTEVMQRHGAYHVDLREFLATLQQKESAVAETPTEEAVIAEPPTEEETDAVEEVNPVVSAAVAELEDVISETDDESIIEGDDDLDELTLTLDGQDVVEFEDVLPEGLAGVVDLGDDDGDIELPELA